MPAKEKVIPFGDAHVGERFGTYEVLGASLDVMLPRGGIEYAWVRCDCSKVAIVDAGTLQRAVDLGEDAKPCACQRIVRDDHKEANRIAAINYKNEQERIGKILGRHPVEVAD